MCVYVCFYMCDCGEGLCAPVRVCGDGLLQASAFHSRCDNVANTFTVIRSDQGVAGGNIFGGYAAGAKLNSGGAYVSSSAGEPFVYSLRNRTGQTVKLTPVNTNHIYAYSGYNVTFGGGHDIVVGGNNARGSNCCDPRTYTTCAAGFAQTAVDNTLLAGTCITWVAQEIEVFAWKR